MGFVELYIGPMFSGKTSLLLSKVSQHKDNIFVITHSSDTRYGKNKLISHDKTSAPASVACASLMPLLFSEELKKTSYIAIEEAQFFGDTVEFVKYVTEVLDKHVFVAGLDGDFKMNPFRTVTDLIPFADVVLKLCARCCICKSSAPFTMRIVKSDEQVLVGAADLYQPVCRQHRN